MRAGHAWHDWLSPEARAGSRPWGRTWGVCLVIEIGLALVLRLAITAPHLSEAI